MLEYGLVGKSLKHSFSKQIHNYIARYNYDLFEMSEEELINHLKSRDFKGFNITIPYKSKVLPYLDEISENAKKIGAVNCIKNDNGRLIGENTDIMGLDFLLQNKNINLSDKKVIILGSGGTSKTACVLCKNKNAKQIDIVSRKPCDNEISYEQAKELIDTDIIINTTPAGMYPNTDELPISLDTFKNLESVVDVIYNPLRTRLLIDANNNNKNIITESGLYMLIAQAIKAAEFFTDKKYKDKIYNKTYRAFYKQKVNIVLIGMPTCGKTTLGRRLSKILKKDFIDTDEIIIQKENRSISQIFEDDGEEYFRKVESDVVRELSLSNNKIIATGGGVILNSDNITQLKKNGLIVFIDKDVDRLFSTSTRPTMSTKEEIIKRYNERYDKYTKSADIIFKSSNNISTDEVSLERILLHEDINY